MHLSSYVVYVLVSFYSVLGIFLVRQARRPTCRICLHRHNCPNRLRGPSRYGEVPACSRRDIKTQAELLRIS